MPKCYVTILAEIYGHPLFCGSSPGFVNRTQSHPGFVNPVRSGPGFCQSDPIRSGPGFVNARDLDVKHLRFINRTLAIYKSHICDL